MKSIAQRTAACFIAASLALFSGSLPMTAQPLDPSNQADEEDRLAAFDPASLPTNAEVPSDLGENPRITLELKGVDVLDVLKILAQRSGINIVAGKNVRGQVTIYLKDVLIREALDTIISTLGLAYEDEEGIIKVMTDKEYEVLHGRTFREPRLTKTFKIKHADPKAVQQVIQQLKGPLGKVILDERTNTLIVYDLPEVIDEISNAIRELDEALVTKVFKLEYATVEDLEEKLKNYVTPESGIIQVDKRTNKVSVTDRKEKVARIAEIVEAFDTRPQQVLIEAQIIEVELFDAFRWGIDWDYVRGKLLKEFTNITLNPTFTVAAPSDAELGSGTLSTFTFTRGIGGLNTVLSILQSVGKTNTLSAPRIMVINNEEAKLTDATKRPYVTSTITQSTNTSATADTPEFIDVGVILTIVPTISDENTVILKLKPEVSTASSTDFSYNTAQGSVTNAYTTRAIPIVSTQTLETTVFVKSAETLVVGGLIKETQSKIRRKLPILGDIPVLGAAFRSETIDFKKSELVIFMTPYVISGETTSREHRQYFTPEGNLVDFDKVGGYDFAKGQIHSQGTLRMDSRPYWEIRQLKFPRYWYWPSHNFYSRVEPYWGGRNTLEGFTEGRALPAKHLLLKAYEEKLGQSVISGLSSLELLKKLKGKIDLALSVRRDGVLEDVSFIDAGEITDRKLRRAVLQKIREASPFPEFPAELESERELFDLRFEFQTAGKNEEEAKNQS